jgi:transposase InsO family protein
METRAFHLPLQHLHLVPEHQELDVLLILRATSGSEQTADEEVHERAAWSSCRYNFNRPHGGLGGQTPYEKLRQKTRARP